MVIKERKRELKLLDELIKSPICRAVQQTLQKTFVLLTMEVEIANFYIAPNSSFVV